MASLIVTPSVSDSERERARLERRARRLEEVIAVLRLRSDAGRGPSPFGRAIAGNQHELAVVRARLRRLP